MVNLEGNYRNPQKTTSCNTDTKSNKKSEEPKNSICNFKPSSEKCQTHSFQELQLPNI